MSAAIPHDFRSGDRTRLIFGALIVVIACQGWLIFEKAIN